MSPKHQKHRILSNFTKQSLRRLTAAYALCQLRIGGSYLQNHQKHRILSNFTKQSLRRLTTLMLYIRARLLVGPLEANQDLGFLAPADPHKCGCGAGTAEPVPSVHRYRSHPFHRNVHFSSRVNDCAAPPLQSYCCNGMKTADDASGTSRHLELLRATNL